MTTRADSGFTLIEALVAMAVLAVAASGFVRATEGHIDTIAAIEARTTAGWVAENRLAEARVPGLGGGIATSPMLHHAWQTTIATHASDDPDIAALTVTVGNGRTQTTLRGFADTASPPPIAESSGAAAIGVPVAAAGPPR